jgi:multidrug transporter EmrE-like cation transporter
MINWRVIALFAAHALSTAFAGAGFKLSAASSDTRGFLFWQVLGNLAGFCSVLALTGLLRFFPLHVAYPVSQGVAIMAVNLISARLIFRETITTQQWMGAALIIGGIVLITARRA